MTNVTAEEAKQHQSSESSMEQAHANVEGAVGQMQEQTQQVRGKARKRVSEELDARTTQAGDQIRETADALRQTGRTMRDQGKEGPATTIDRAAGQADRLASYLSEASGDRLLRDVERFARRQPWVVTAGGLVAGFFASRFLKASSGGRYDSGDAMYSTRSSQRTGQPALPSPSADDLGSAEGGDPVVGRR
jgi:hypothetical protein